MREREHSNENSQGINNTILQLQQKPLNNVICLLQASQIKINNIQDFETSSNNSQTIPRSKL